MAGQDDLIKIILDVQGEEKITQARKAIEQEKDAIRQLDAALRAGTISQAQFDAASLKSAVAIKQSTQAIQQAGGKFNPRSLLEFSRAAEDAQFGIAGVVNNIPGLVQSFGGKDGLIGVASLAAIAIAQLVKNWDAVAAAFSGPAVKTAAEELDDLRKKTSLTADEFERLNRANRLDSTVSTLRSARPEAVEKADAATAKAISEAGASDVVSGVLAAAPEMVAQSGNVSAAQTKLDDNRKYIAERESLARDNFDPQQRDRATGDAEAAKKQTFQLQTNLLAAQKDAAEKLVASSALEKDYQGARGRLIKAIEGNAAAFGPNAGQLLSDLKAVGKMKTSDEEEDTAAQEHYDAQERAFASKLASWQDDTDEELAAQKHLEATQKDANEKLAAFQERMRQETVDEQVQARVKDMTESRNRSAQIFSGPASLRDSVQGSFKKDNTAVEALSSSRQIEASARRTVELLQGIERNVGGPARAG